MLTRVLRRAGGVLALGGCILAAGCSTPTSEPDPAATARTACDEQIASLVAELQLYVDGFEASGALAYATGVDLPDPDDVERALEQRRQGLEQLGCDPIRSQQVLSQRLDGLQGDGGIADAVARSLRATLLGGGGEEPRELDVEPGDDLAAIAVTAPGGSTLRLSAGEHHLDDPIIVAAPLRIVGAGQDRTRLVSAGEEAALIVLASAGLHLSDLTIRHEAEETAAVVVLLSPRATLEDVTVRGARSQGDGLGGVGVFVEVEQLGPAQGRDLLPEVTGTLLSGLTVQDNDGPGIAVTGPSSPRVVDAVVRDNGLCGVCFLGVGGGSLEGSTVSGNLAGVVVAGRAAPRIVGNRIDGNDSDGILFEAGGRGTVEDNDVVGNQERGITLTDDAAGTFHRNRIGDNSEVAVAVVGSATATFADNEMTGHPIGVWVDESADVELGDNRIDAEGEVGVIVTGEARGTLDANTIQRHRYGVELREDAIADLQANRIEVTDVVAVIVRDRARVTGQANTCVAQDAGVLLLDDATSDLDDDCTVVSADE
jgi:parallel beta-helix repeat protein